MMLISNNLTALNRLNEYLQSCGKPLKSRTLQAKQYHELIELINKLDTDNTPTCSFISKHYVDICNTLSSLLLADFSFQLGKNSSKHLPFSSRSSYAYAVNPEDFNCINVFELSKWLETLFSLTTIVPLEISIKIEKEVCPCKLCSDYNLFEITITAKFSK